MGRFSTFCASAARGAPHWQHDGDAAVGHGRTPVERSAHRAPSEACPSHVVRAEQVSRGGPADRGAASRPPFKPPLGAAHVCWQRRATEERMAGAAGVIWAAMAGLCMLREQANIALHVLRSRRHTRIVICVTYNNAEHLYYEHRN